MSKITLNEAKKVISELEIIDAFASIIGDTVAEDEFKLYTYEKLYNKIYSAEKYFGIDYILNQIKILEKQAKYYDPVHAVFYYKENIDEHIKNNNKDIYTKIIKNKKKLQDSIEEISEHIYIEVDE